MDLVTVHQHLASLSHIRRIQTIQKGFSIDGKYFLYVDTDVPILVLRTATLEQWEKKKREFDTVCRVYRNGVKTSQPIEFGTIESLNVCYMILSYVDGEDASEILPSLTSDEQYKIGINAGSELRLMHQLEAPSGMETWAKRRTAKYRRQLAEYKNCGVTLSQSEAVIAFIEDHLKLMNNRPNRLLHDDFHPGNLLIRDKCYSGAIDYNRYDWGDPFHDFLKIAYFSRQVSTPFSIGQIHGYFAENVPEQFWSLYSLYTALNIIPTITWTQQVVPDQLESMMDRIQVVLDDHANFEHIIPVWYKS